MFEIEERAEFISPLFLYVLDHAAGDPGSAVTSRLRVKVVPLFMKNNGAANHIRRTETVCINCQKSSTAAGGKKGREIPAVPGMG